MNINNLPEPYRTLAFIRREQRDRTIYHNHTDVLEAAFGWADHNEGYFWGNIQKGKFPPLTEQSIKDIVVFLADKFEGINVRNELEAININVSAIHPKSFDWGFTVDMDKILINPIGAEQKPQIYPIFVKRADGAQITNELQSSLQMEIKVTGCDSCPFNKLEIELDVEIGQSCSHPFNHYDGNKDEWFEYCPLKQADTVVKFEKP